MAEKSTFEGVVNGVLSLLVIVFCADDSVKEMEEKGLRAMGDTGSWVFVAVKACFFTGRPAMSKPLLPIMK